MLETKICQTQKEKKQKWYLKGYYYIRKYMLNDLTDPVEKLENVSLSK